jgi:hypothetical protein
MACVVWFVGTSLDSGLDGMALKAFEKVFEKAFGWEGTCLLRLHCVAA